MDDLVPELLVRMLQDFETQVEGSKKIKELREKLNTGTATYKEANEYASEVGKITKSIYEKHLTSANLPDGKCYYNIADRVTSSTLHDQYKLVADYTEQVQSDLNKKAGIGLKAQRADEDTEGYHSLANHMSAAEHYDDVAKSTAQSAERFSRSTVDSSIKKNVDFQGKSGLKPKIVRSGGTDCCDWCSSLSGTYDYPKVPKEVYARHNNCTCTVEYDPGSGKRQDVWSKNWISEEDARKRDELRSLGLDTEDKHAKIEYRRTNLPASGDNIGIQIRSVPEQIKEPSTAELTRRMIAGQSNPDNQGVIAKRIIDGDYSLKQKHQKYLQHIEGTPQYLSATEGRNREQSVLYISEDKAQELIYKYAGTGEAKLLTNGSVGNKEYISVDEIIGKYFERGEWHDTSRIQIVYGKAGSHIVPVKER